MAIRKLMGVRPRSVTTFRKIVAFPFLLAVAAVTVLGEILFVFLLPDLTNRYQKQIERAEDLLAYPSIVLREYESLQMIPPTIGVLYRRQTVSKPRETEFLFAKLLALNDAERLEVLRQGAVSDEAYVAVLGRCFGGGQEESQLEEFLVRSVQSLEDGQYVASLVADKLYRNYFYVGERSQYAGLIEDARRSYRRFVQLARVLNRDSGLGVDLHRHLNRANVRLKILAAEHVFATEVVQKIQDGPADMAISFIDYGDQRLAALARYNAASFLWHEDKADEAVTLLRGANCGALNVECKFLLAKIIDSQADNDYSVVRSKSTTDLAREARSLLDDLIRKLPGDHPLLDDIYFHRAIVAQHREDKQGAFAELRELERCCPNTDLVTDVNLLRDELDGRIYGEQFDE